MVLPKSKNAVGLGNSLMNDRFGRGKGADMRRGNAVQGGITRKGQNGETYVTNNKSDAAYMKMRSVTEQAALDEFLSTAELAGTDFTAEKMNNVKIIHTDQKNPYLLSANEERATARKQDRNRKRLTVPRRPQWDEKTTRQQLDEREREALVEWRRGLASMQENDDLLMTPFERNLEVWRQLWRVIERSDLVVQIVDARNPLLFRCEDLEKYVKEVDKRKRNLLLVNKADMMTLEQRHAWASYFSQHKINFRFFSAELAKEMNEARGLTSGDVHDDMHDHSSVSDEGHDDAASVQSDDDDTRGVSVADHPTQTVDADIESDRQSLPHTENDTNHDEDTQDYPTLSFDEQIRILTTDELEALFLAHSPDTPHDQDASQPARKTQIGLVGYPNVGKSSSINALLGAKKVSVSATPGKTKHFQTIHLSEKVILCDCPGLVFPNFASTKAELVCNGILPIDQVREYTGPATLVGQRIPQSFLQAIYGMRIHTRPLEEGGTGTPTGAEVLRAYATARGFSTQGLGQPDESRAARYILKDYVKGKLLFCHPPPADPTIDPIHFNRELYDADHLPERRRAAMINARSLATAFEPVDTHSTTTINSDPDAQLDLDISSSNANTQPALPQGSKSKHIDKRFFASNGNANDTVKLPFHAQYSEQSKQLADDAAQLNGGKQLSGRKARLITALEKGLGPDEAHEAMSAGANTKKHFKANKKSMKKVRSEYD